MTEIQTGSENPPLRGDVKREWIYAPLVFALITFAMFFDVLFTSQKVLSSQNTDVSLQFLAWRDFGFSQLRHGNLPLWNPHIYGGAPFFAGFQSALLYPFNWLHLILPTGLAINWVIAVHVFFAGYFTYLWCRSSGRSIAAGILAGIMFMFCGPYFLHVYAGHLPHVAVMVWTPIMLIVLDKLAATGKLRWCLFGIVAVSMQILAGHPQYVYYTGIALTIYALVNLWHAENWMALLGGFFLMYFGAVLVTAVQLLPGVQAASEQVRSGGLAYEIASTFSLPPENALTLLAPSFFGNIPSPQYWGAGYLWEMSLFISIAGLVLAIFAVVRGWNRPVLIAAIMILITTLLALGRHTWLYSPMFQFVPEYSSFRGTVKFAYIAALFVCWLAAEGFDELRRQRKVEMPIVAGIFAIVAAMAIAGAMIWNSSQQGPDGFWGHFVASVITTAKDANELFYQLKPLDPAFITSTGQHAAEYLFVAAATLLIVGGIFAAARFNKWIPYSLLAVVAIEMFVFARCTRATMNPADTLSIPPLWQQPLASVPKDERVLTPAIQYANLGMSLGFNNLNGYDPGVLKRYAETIYAFNGVNPSNAQQYLPFRQINRNFLLLFRCALVLNDQTKPPFVTPDHLKSAILMDDWVQMSSRDAILYYLISNSFDPAKTAVVETDPGIAKSFESASPGDVILTDTSTDTAEIDANVFHPSILVIAKNYTTGWRVIPHPGSQAEYHIIPVNYTQIGIPLQPGKHVLTLEYSPLAFRAGKWISIAAIFTLLVVSFLLMRRKA